MAADWRKQGFDPNLLANRLEKLKHVDPATSVVSFRGFEVEEVVTVLHSALSFAEKMPEAIQRQIIMEVAFDRARAGRITGSNLLHEIRKREASYAHLPQERYVLSTSLSVRHFPSLTSTEVSGHRVTYGSLPDRFQRAYEEARSQAEGQIQGPLPDRGISSKRYTPARISVRARSQNEAMEEALEALDLLRGMWNYLLNRPVGMRSSGGQRKPVNRIVLGPLYCLHRPTGELTTASPWIDTDYAGSIKPYNLGGIGRISSHARTKLGVPLRAVLIGRSLRASSAGTCKR